MTSHYLNQWWPSSVMHICGTRGRWVKKLCNIFSIDIFDITSKHLLSVQWLQHMSLSNPRILWLEKLCNISYRRIFVICILPLKAPCAKCTHPLAFSMAVFLQQFEVRFTHQKLLKENCQGWHNLISYAMELCLSCIKKPLEWYQ